MFRITSCAVAASMLGALLFESLPAGATPVATGTIEESAATLMLGRKNPFRPLILPDAPGTRMPVAPVPPSAPGALPLPKPMATPPELTYVGLAYDGAESIAAVKVNGKVRFVRRGDRVAGATLVRISPTRLVWKKNRKRLESPLRHRPGDPTP